LKRKRSRQLHYGVMQLCEVIHRRVVAGKQLLLTKNNAKFGKVGPAAEALELIAQDLKQAASIITTPRDQDIKMMNDLRAAALRSGARPEELSSPASPSHYDLGLPDDPFAAFPAALLIDATITAKEPPAPQPSEVGLFRVPLSDSVIPTLTISSTESSPIHGRSSVATPKPLHKSTDKDFISRSRSATIGTGIVQPPLRSSRDDAPKPIRINLAQASGSNNSSPVLVSPRASSPPLISAASSLPQSRGSLIDSYYSAETTGMDDKLRNLLRTSVELPTSPRKSLQQLPSNTPVVSKSWAKQKYFDLSEDEHAQLEFLLNTEVEILFLWADSIVRFSPLRRIWLPFLPLLRQIQYAATKKNDTLFETLLTAAADKFADTIKIDPMNVLTISRKRQAVEDQTKENRRMLFAVAEINRVICSQNATAENLFRWATSLLGYAKLHQEDAVKHAELHKQAGRKVSAALKLSPDLLDRRLEDAMLKQQSELEFWIRLLLDCPLLKERARVIGASVNRIELSGAASFTDVMFDTLIDICPATSYVDISGCRRLSDDSVCSMAQQLSGNLRTLYAAGCEKISDASVIALSKYATHLQSISLAGCLNITDISLPLLLGSFPCAWLHFLV
jgi:hypothetical protein